MAELQSLLALAGPAREGEPNPMAGLVMMGLIFAVFYFVLILPMRRKQRKLEALVKELKTGDKVLLNSGIFGTFPSRIPVAICSYISLMLSLL